MKALVFDRFGEPAEVLAVRDVPDPEPGPGQVRVRMIASPINPSDLLVVRGRYGVLPALPATPGFEGVGIVDKIGPGLNPLGRLVRGKRVMVINHAGGNWAEYAVIPARQARPMPSDLPDEQVAAAFVNPATVLAMVRYVLRVPRRAWLMQSAANSELGKMVIRLGRVDGFKTLNIVRRPEAVAELQKLGADAVICTATGPLEEQATVALGGQPVHYAIDPVGGEIGSRMLELLDEGGRMVAFGSLSEEPLRVPSRLLIARRILLQGFWLGHFMRGLSIPTALGLFRDIGRLIGDGTLTTTVSRTYPLDEASAATAAAEAPGRDGKILFRLRPGSSPGQANSAP